MRSVLLNGLAICLGLTLLAGATGAPLAAAEAPHHDMVLTLDPARAAIKISDRIRVPGRTDIALHLADWMGISEIRVDGRTAPTRSRGPVVLTLPNADQHQIEVMAEGILAAAAPDAD